MVVRQALALLMVLTLAFPAWGDANIVGSVASSQSATVRGAELTPGSTVFSGDTINVGTRGGARIALPGGAQVQMGENSQISLNRADGRIQLAIARGLVSFRTAEKAEVETLLADATIRSADGLPVIGIINWRSPNSAVVAAQKGVLLITTGDESKSLTLRAGEGAELTLAQDKDQENEKNKKKRRAAGGYWPASKVVAAALILGGAATAIGILLGRGEVDQANKGNAISPFRFP